MDRTSIPIPNAAISLLSLLLLVVMVLATTAWTSPRRASRAFAVEREPAKDDGKIESAGNRGPDNRGGLVAVLRLLGDVDDAAIQQDLLTGTLEGLVGRRRVSMPSVWPGIYRRLQASRREQVRELALQLAIRFDDPRAFEMLRDRAANARTSPVLRQRAIAVLVASKDAELPPLLLRQLSDKATRRAALRGLAEYNHRDTVASILRVYSDLDGPARQDALQTLAARKEWARQLLGAVESEHIPRRDVTAYTVRQLRSLGDRDLTRRIGEVWGSVQATPADKQRQIDAHKRYLKPSDLARSDPVAGRVLFQRICAGCHRLFGEGTAVGPDITGSQRSNLQYLMENIVAPNAAVAKDFQMELVATTGGRVITGLVIAEDGRSITVQTVNEKIVVPTDEIDQRKKSSLSLMPEGLLRKLAKQDIRNLVAYLSGPHQVPLPSPSGDK